MKLDYPATARNQTAILATLRGVLGDARSVLEVASGSGQHATFFAAELPHVTWQPSSYEEEERASIAAYRSEMPDLLNLLPPVALDVHDQPWPLEAVDAVFCANMIHIAPWSACVALFEGASRVLRAGGALITYGPYRFDGGFTADSNANFDASLRRRNPSWGVRDVSALAEVGAPLGFALVDTQELPANNHVLVWRC